MEQFLWLLPLGLVVGTFGTIIGAGGGFILVPILLLIYPDKSPEIITSISLAVVLVNAVSGSAAYAGMKRIDYKSGLIFAAATVPGAILGALTTSLIPRGIFNGVFGVVMIAASVFLVFKPSNPKSRKTGAGGAIEEIKAKHLLSRSITDSSGIAYTYSVNLPLGIIISLLVGYISSVVGIGGGIIHVPVLVHIMGFPVHIATATSLFALTAMSLSCTAVHLTSGVLLEGLIQVVALSIGVLVGAQIGARLSKRLRGTWIIRSLATGLAIAGLRIFIMAFG